MHVSPHARTFDPLVPFKADPNWIKGAGVTGAPNGADPPLDAFLAESVDWSALLVTGKQYKLRQNFYRHAERSHEFDATFTFTYNGFVTQNDAINAGQPVRRSVFLLLFVFLFVFLLLLFLFVFLFLLLLFLFVFLFLFLFLFLLFLFLFLFFFAFFFFAFFLSWR